MKKLAALLLCFCFFLASPVTAFAQSITQDGSEGSAVISASVPDSHTVTVDAEHAQVFYNSVSGTEFTVDRLSEPRFLIRPENGWRVAKVTLNGENVTAQLMSGYLTLPAVYENKAIVVETVVAPPDTDSTHGISGTITDENGNPVSDATVDIGGNTGKTDENGNFTIPNVPDGYHPVTITDKDGTIIGYTEIEFGRGETGVTAKENGTYLLNSQKNADLKLELALSANGVASVQKVTDITPVKNADTSLTSPKTGAAVGILLPCAFLAAALWILLSFKRKSNKQTS